MADKRIDFVYEVTREEYQQFLDEGTFYPECMEIDASGLPDCLEHCPRGLVCTPFSYVDPEHGVDMQWFACAPPEIHAQLESRRVAR